MNGLSADAIERGLIERGVPREKARAIALAETTTRQSRHVPSVTRRTVTAPVDGCARPIAAKRLEDGGLWLSIPVPPRTKKNHGRAFGIRQSRGYVRYRDYLVSAMKPLLSSLDLPLAARPYNLCARYYVDPKGKTADLFGLHQGLADALQNAEVICNDWYFRTADGSAVIPDDPHPRVEVIITPLAA